MKIALEIELWVPTPSLTTKADSCSNSSPWFFLSYKAPSAIIPIPISNYHCLLHPAVMDVALKPLPRARDCSKKAQHRRSLNRRGKVKIRKYSEGITKTKNEQIFYAGASSSIASPSPSSLPLPYFLRKRSIERHSSSIASPSPSSPSSLPLPSFLRKRSIESLEQDNDYDIPYGNRQKIESLDRWLLQIVVEVLDKWVYPKNVLTKTIWLWL